MSLILATTGRAKTLVSLKAPHHFVSGRLSERIPPPRVISGPAVSGRACQNCKYIDPHPSPTQSASLRVGPGTPFNKIQGYLHIKVRSKGLDL